MSTILSIDPGLHGCGCGFWVCENTRWSLQRGFFAAGARLKNSHAPEAWFNIADSLFIKLRQLDVKPTCLVVETMKVYTMGKAKPDDLLHLMAVAGCVVGRFPEVEVRRGFLPSEWKGQVPKDIMAARVEKKVRERGWWDRVEVPRSKAHLNDVMHGIGIGMHYIEKVLPFDPVSEG